jgi:alkylation response protein AidB-like acyl-CoA dehydrogenase
VSKDVDGMINKFKAEGRDQGRAAIEGISHYAVEDAILKVWGSEMLDFVADEGVQIHGGMGYSAEMNVDRGYRDSRINRIFEGTNEINRLLVVEAATKLAKKGEYNLFEMAEEIHSNLDSITDGKKGDESYFEEKRRYISNFKKAIMLTIQSTTQALGRKFMNEQEVVNNLANMIMELYEVESMALRIEKLESLNQNKEVYKDMLDVFAYDTAYLIYKNAADAIYSSIEGEETEKLLEGIKTLTSVAGINVMQKRRNVANVLIEENQYKF